MRKCDLGEILHIQKGKKPQSQSNEALQGYLPYVDIKAFEKGIIENYASTEKSLLCEDGDLLIVCDGSRSGLTGRAIKGVVGSTLAKISADGLTTEYLRYFIQSKYTLLNTQKKGTGTPHLNAEILKSSIITVPSLHEQDRIVSRIEELFSELDKAVETLQTTKKQLAVYRQAVLKEAFEGQLTREWRKVNDVKTATDFLTEIQSVSKTMGYCAPMEEIGLSSLPSEWKWVSIGDISMGAKYGTSKKSDENGIVPVIRMGNIQNGVILWDELVFSNDESEIKEYNLEIGDVLFNRTNSPEWVGKTAVFKESKQAIYAGYLIKMNQVKNINPYYLTYYMNSSTARRYGNKVKTDGVNQSNINSKKMYSYPFPLCSREEQDEVVFELETRLSVCDSIKKTVDFALSQAETMRQSILKKAFEGEL